MKLGRPVNLTLQQWSFLKTLAIGARPGPADRQADKVRQWCRRNGLAEVVQNPRRWQITVDGLRALTGGV